MTKATPHPRVWGRLQPLGVILTASTILVSAATADHWPEPGNACAAYLHSVAIVTAAKEQWASRPDSEAAIVAAARAQESRRAARTNVIAKLSEHWDDELVHEMLTHWGKSERRERDRNGEQHGLAELPHQARSRVLTGGHRPSFTLSKAALDSVLEAEHTMLTLLCDQSARMHQ